MKRAPSPAAGLQAPRATVRFRPRAGAWRAAGLLVLGLLPLLVGCSGSRFGESLSRSFSASPAAAGAPAPAGSAAPAGSSAAAGSGAAAGASTPAPSRPGNALPNASPAGSSPGSGRPGATAGPTTPDAAGAARPGAATGGAGTGATGQAASPATARPPAAPPRPAPYRVTILLPQADAAAPAEVVTQALRAAGVPFEVETIERLAGSDRPQQPPVSRPAPEPR